MKASELLLQSARPFDEACEKVLALENDLDYAKHAFASIKTFADKGPDSFESSSISSIADGALIMLSSPEGSKSPIEACLAQYESEGDDFSDLEWACDSALRQVHFMGDSQVRCLLYTLANAMKEKLV